MDLRCATVECYCIDNLFHYFRVIAWMDACFFLCWMRVGFNCHSFLCVISHNILKNLWFWQHLSILRVTNKPKSRSLVIEVICDTQVVCPCFVNCVFLLVHNNIFAGTKHIDIFFPLLILNIIDVHNFLVILLLFIINVNDLSNVIDVHSGLLSSGLLRSRIVGLNPAIFNFTLLCLLSLQGLDSFGAWNSLGNEVLFFSR